MDTFKEEGSGLSMRLDLYYVLSESGSAYFPIGFESVEVAKTQTRKVWPDTEVEAPKFLGGKEGWETAFEANIYLGADLKAFWEANPLE